MRLDHIAFRCNDRLDAANFFVSALGYKIQQEFTIDFGNGQTAQCIALEPPEKQKNSRWVWEGWEIPAFGGALSLEEFADHTEPVRYHMAPEFFVSDGSPGSIVDNWVKKHGPGIHHFAYQVESVEKTMQEWKEKGYAEFSSDVIKCPGLTQVFTKPSKLTGIIYEFIERGEHGFCKDNVKLLMESTKSD